MFYEVLEMNFFLDITLFPLTDRQKVCKERTHPHLQDHKAQLAMPLYLLWGFHRL